ncbi:protein windbeutel [Aedes albopictus]|uniref:Endoplasmic reticulum resident protein 29 n=1 Tax=Aedes albopictus TaxID=7160 RepID=A0ABM1ZPK5_AEDAL
MSRLVPFLLVTFYIGASWASNGCVELDKLSFDKIVKRFRYTLVKFDVAFPYGEKHEAFTSFALESNEALDDLLFALVGIKDYGEKENADLGKRFKIPEKYPVIKLFNNETLDTYVDYPEDDPITVDSLRKFVSANTDLYIGLPGCLKEIDELAAKFSCPKKSKEALLEIVTETEQMENLFSAEKAHKSFQIYLTLMRKMAQSDKSVKEFIAGEKDRVRNLLKGKISDNKKADLNLRLNIMESFKSGRTPDKAASDEL